MDIFNIDFGQLLFRVKLLSISLSVVFGGLAVYFIISFRQLVGVKVEKAKLAIRAPEVPFGGAAQSVWEEVMRHIQSTKETDWKFAIIEADKLVDNLLKASGFPGDSMGERLTNMEKGQIQNLDGLWEAHKIRNKLVHDMNYFLRYAEAKRAIEVYENVLKELNAI